MENKEFAKQLENRIKNFAIAIIRLSISLPLTEEGKVLKNQLTKAGASIGANYREANCARSKADFKNKMSISESEASETAYWLEIITKLKWIDDTKCLFRNKVYRIGEVILFVNKAKNTGIATLWRVFLTKLASKRTRLNVSFISEQTLKLMQY